MTMFFKRIKHQIRMIEGITLIIRSKKLQHTQKTNYSQL